MTEPQLRQSRATEADRSSGTAASGRPPAQFLRDWLGTQAVNVLRHAGSIRRFGPTEFGNGPEAPSSLHVEAVNRFIEGLRIRVQDSAREVEAAVRRARREPTPGHLDAVLERKQRVGAKVQYVEGIWDFYATIFAQRLTPLGPRLLAVDRIAANCYQDVFDALGTARPVPRLLPLTLADGSPLGPRTYRRAVPLTRLRRHPNLFPLVVLPQHRLDAVHAMSSVLHEVSHNLQADLGVWEPMPGRIARALLAAGVPGPVAGTWAGWHKEITADLLALLLGGPAAVESLMDVVARSRGVTTTFAPGTAHPTPYLRVLISCELLRRLGLAARAHTVATVWRRLYPGVGDSDIPGAVLRTFSPAAESVVDTIAFRPHPELGGRSFAQLLPAGPSQAAQIRWAGRQLANGRAPLGVPPRLLIGAARHAVEHRLADPQTVTDNFYLALGRR